MIKVKTLLLLDLEVCLYIKIKMVNKAVIFVVIFFFILFIAIAIIFFTFKNSLNPPEVHLDLYNVSLRFYDNDTNRQTVTDYNIYVNNTLYHSGTSTPYDFIREQLPRNSSIFIVNHNRNNQTYYLNKFSYSDTFGQTSNTRVEIPLQKYGNLTLNQDGKLGADNPVNLNVLANGEARYLILCVRWSSDIITVNPIADKSVNSTYEFTAIPQRLYNKVDHCYDLKMSLTDKGLSIPISYKVFGSITDKDYINVYIIDKEYTDDTLTTLSFETTNGSDVAIKDVEFIMH